jgi:hypothetical protein
MHGTDMAVDVLQDVTFEKFNNLAVLSKWGVVKRS